MPFKRGHPSARYTPFSIPRNQFVLSVMEIGTLLQHLTVLIVRSARGLHTFELHESDCRAKRGVLFGTSALKMMLVTYSWWTVEPALPMEVTTSRVEALNHASAHCKRLIIPLFIMRSSSSQRMKRYGCLGTSLSVDVQLEPC